MVDSYYISGISGDWETDKEEWPTAERLTTKRPTSPAAKRRKQCICVDFINNNPDPVPNPDCPVHGILYNS